MHSLPKIIDVIPHKLNTYNCFHCDLSFTYAPQRLEEKVFCCQGCKTVYQIILENDLDTFYSIVPNAGNIPTEGKDLYAILDIPEFNSEFVSFKKGKSTHATFSIPSIHCSACIWILEQLNHFESGIQQSIVNFSGKSIQFIFNSEITSLRSIAELLSSLGYPPDISLGHKNQKKETKNHLVLQLGIAGFAFGNCMFLSLSTYFESQEFWILQFRPWFDLLSFIMSIPVLLYSAKDYFLSALKGFKARVFTLNIPIALGISVLFLKSTYVVFFTTGLGYFDSLTGLIFFLLIGKFMQQKVYSTFSYDRDYTSFFPMGIHKVLRDNSQSIIPIKDLKIGDEIAIRFGELIPVDCILTSEEAQIDYSFVTGESKAVIEKKGALLFAGGKVLKQNGTANVKKTVDESALVQLWKQSAFQKKNHEKHYSITDKFSRYFTPFILAFAGIISFCWVFIAPERIVDVLTSILIVACPCALALSAPFILGNMLRYLDKLSFYPRSTEVLEKITKITHIVFDKTGTLTDPNKYKISFVGSDLNRQEKKAIKSICYQSNHPLSTALFSYLAKSDYTTSLKCIHHVGAGLEALFEGDKIKIGSANFIKTAKNTNEKHTVVHLEISAIYRGYFKLQPCYRPNLKTIFEKLNQYDISVLSGDTIQSQKEIKKFIPLKTNLFFEQNPFQKINYIKKLQKQGAKVMMIGDGLNDAGALQQSDVGIAINNKTHSFSPACDAILLGENLHHLVPFMNAIQNSKHLIYTSFVFSLLYNLIGLSIAALGLLTPLIAAILMPLSSISVVLFAYGSTYFLYASVRKKLKT